MIETASVQNARARARARRVAPAPVKPRIRVMAAIAAPPETPPPTALDDSLQPLPQAAAHEDEDAPFDPPDPADLIAMGAWQDEADEEVCFLVPDPAESGAAIAELPLEAPAELGDTAPVPEPAPEPAPAPSEAQLQFELDAISLIAAHASALAPEEDDPGPAPEPAQPVRSLDPIYDQPVPPIVIHGSWDRQDIAALLGDFAADKRLARATVTLERGGVDAALVRFARTPAPDLLILDSTLRARELLAGVDKLAALIGAKAKIFVVGAVNDIALLRELSARGVKYVVPPIRRDDLARAVCGLYAEADNSRVIAVMGARGGVGASTIAHNLAWSIAERCGADTTLVDLDLAFGAAAFNVQRPAPQSVADVAAADPRDIAAIERAAVHHTPRLQILAAPADLGAGLDFDAHALETLVMRARRATSYVVLDLPHAWNGWVRRALTLADDVLIVAGPDLASLRNADNMLRVLKGERAEAPLVALSMTGVPKRPEIPARDFAEALGAAPVASFPYDPPLHGAAALAGRMLGEAAPRARATQTIENLACALTGLPVVKHKKKVQTLRAAEHAIAAAAQRVQPAAELPAVDEPPLELVAVEDAYLAKARAAAEAGAPQKPSEAPQRSATRPLRVAAYVLAIVLMGAFARMQSDREAGAEAHTTAAASALDASAQTREALALIGEGRARQAIALLRPAAEDGYAPAQYVLARAYARGEGVGPDLALARRWTERAAAAGHARAMHDLGVFNASGEGGRQDDAAAFRWFRQAAEFNVADSQYNLGVLYAEGRGVTANPDEALFWFKVAAAQGDQAAAARAHVIEGQLNAEQIVQAQARADAFRPRAFAQQASAP